MSPARPLLRVVTSAESAARDAAAINAGAPSRALMQRAGAAAAGEIALRLGDRLHTGVLVFAGPGNNGGDGWVVARALAATGVDVRVAEPIAAKTPDAIAERELALSSVDSSAWRDNGDGSWQGEGVVVDGLLGTGSSGTPRGALADGVRAIARARERGATIVAIDLPTGLDATNGEARGSVTADLTLTFGTMKRGHLVSRSACGVIVVLDIGLGAFAALDDGAPCIVDEAWIASRLPAIGAESHKGTRRKLAIVGGARGMAGASVLAARAAMRSGIGMVRLVVEPVSLDAVQQAEPFALAGAWPNDDAALDREIVGWADGVVIGPGLGSSRETRALVERVLARWRGPALLDADALNVFDGDLDGMRGALGERGRPALLTPHPMELARLAGASVADVLARRFEIGGEVAKRVGATVLLKGVPTVITAPSGERLVSAAGTPILAAAGSGDILSGIGGTLLAQMGDALAAGAAAAWIHGHAAELASIESGMLADHERAATSSHAEVPAAAPDERRVRGLALADVLGALPAAWRVAARPTRAPVLLELPRVGEGG